VKRQPARLALHLKTEFCLPNLCGAADNTIRFSRRTRGTSALQNNLPKRFLPFALSTPEQLYADARSLQ
jgi:hypothetical protein